jgi:fatty-acid desaturase
LDQPDAAQVRHPHAGDGDEFHDDIIYPSPVPFVLVHLACIGAIWSGVTTGALVLCGVLYLVRMFGVTAGYHRYFSHRTYKTSRAFQFVLALVAQSTTQKGVMWWAAKHRHHHKHADLEDDVHSPRLRGFWYSHLGWIFDPKHDATDLDAVPDLARYPELVWLHRYEKLPAVVLAVLCFVFGGWPGLVVGFFWSTVLVYHGTFMINSLAHVHGKQRYVTGDDSRNNWWLAILTLARGGTTTTTPTWRAPVRGSAGTSTTPPTTCSGRCPGRVSCGTSTSRPRRSCATRRSSAAAWSTRWRASSPPPFPWSASRRRCVRPGRTRQGSRRSTSFG